MRATSSALVPVTDDVLERAAVRGRVMLSAVLRTDEAMMAAARATASVTEAETALEAVMALDIVVPPLVVPATTEEADTAAVRATFSAFAAATASDGASAVLRLDVS